MFSPQSIINGLPRLARRGEIKRQEISGHADRRFYISSTYMGLSFVLREGIARDLSYPLEGIFPDVGCHGKHRNFERVSTFIFWHFIN
jgi:hypothetical protein